MQYKLIKLRKEVEEKGQTMFEMKNKTIKCSREQNGMEI